MLNKDIFFNTNLKKKLNKNIKNAKKKFNFLKSDIKNFNTPLLNSFEKNYPFNFSEETIKKYSKYNNICIIGIGGSILGTKAIYGFLNKKIKKNVFFFDNLDNKLLLKFKKNKKLHNSCFVIVSKSGNTLETLTNLRLISSKKLLKNKIIIITELKNNKLINMAKKYNAEVIEHKEFVGGRFSVLSEVGMFPAGLMNLKTTKFLNLKKLINNKKFVSSLINNVSCIYTFNQLGIKNSVILNYDSELEDLCLWYQQLTAESLGKDGKGITPTISTCPKDHHSLLQLYLDGPKDKFFTFFSSRSKKNSKLQSTIDAQCESVKNIFKNKKIPYRHFIFKKNDEIELGSTFLFFILETILLAQLMKVNPYDQPAVQKIKEETKKILSKYKFSKNYF